MKIRANNRLICQGIIQKLFFVAHHNASDQIYPNKIRLCYKFRQKKCVPQNYSKIKFRQLSSIRVESEHNKERYESQIAESQKLKSELDR